MHRKLITILILIALILILTGCTAYTPAQKRAFLIYTGATAADLITTRQGLQQDCREMNPFLDDRPSDLELISFKAITTGILFGLGEIWPDHREQIWTWAALIQGGASINNVIQANR